MREREMFEPMKKLLASKGYKILAIRKGRQPGADVIAEREGHKLVMEMKGDSAALDVDLGTGVLQLLRHMHKGADEEYALGVSQAYARLVHQIENPLRKLGIKVFVVDGNTYQLW